MLLSISTHSHLRNIFGFIYSTSHHHKINQQPTDCDNPDESDQLSAVFQSPLPRPSFKHGLHIAVCTLFTAFVFLGVMQFEDLITISHCRSDFIMLKEKNWKGDGGGGGGGTDEGDGDSVSMF